MTTATSKALCRVDMLLKRRQLSATEKATAAEQIANFFIDSAFFRENQHFACYLPYLGEVDTLLIHEALWSANKACYLPIVHIEETRPLLFALYEKGDSLVKNRLGILEPLPKKTLPATALDIVLTPLVAFDAQGHRLGMGAGFYDRTFAFLYDLPVPPKPQLIGLAYDFQRVNCLPQDDWDVSVKTVITESGFQK